MNKFDSPLLSRSDSDNADLIVADTCPHCGHALCFSSVFGSDKGDIATTHCCTYCEADFTISCDENGNFSLHYFVPWDPDHDTDECVFSRSCSIPPISVVAPK